jgi:hypothetical protein
MSNLKVMDLIVDAYSIVFFQMSLNSIKADSNGYSYSEPCEEEGLWVLKDQVKFYDQKFDQYTSINFVANEENISGKVEIILPLNLSKAHEFDILKVINRMNRSAGPFSTSYNNKTDRVEINSYLSYVGSPAIFGKESGVSYEYEVQVFANILAGALGQASYWIDKLAILEDPNNSALDVFRLIKQN